MEIREFLVNEEVIKHSKVCPVCKKEFKLKEKIILCPIQRPKSGTATVMAIPIHTKCYIVEK